ncbi:type II secretion system protein [Candidatus Woesebacteria bacterium]|nr:type II secretion system protein [Candidatus Woesebacteria bacterium]
MLKFLPKIQSLSSRAPGFTMIELLIVITILGILATAVLSAINPLEQINRGRDTGTQSDAEQFINAIDRYNAFQGYYPWVTSENAPFVIPTLQTLVSGWTDPANCYVFEKLSSSNNTDCTGTNELKTSYTSRITNGTARNLFVYNHGNAGDSTYVCFKPQSQAFKEKAKNRCGVGGISMPGDLVDVAAALCTAGDEYICLP